MVRRRGLRNRSPAGRPRPRARFQLLYRRRGVRRLGPRGTPVPPRHVDPGCGVCRRRCRPVRQRRPCSMAHDAHAPSARHLVDGRNQGWDHRLPPVLPELPARAARADRSARLNRLQRAHAELLCKAAHYEDAAELLLELGIWTTPCAAIELACGQLIDRCDWDTVLRWAEALGTRRLRRRPALLGAVIPALRVCSAHRGGTKRSSASFMPLGDWPTCWPCDDRPDHARGMDDAVAAQGGLGSARPLRHRRKRCRGPVHARGDHGRGAGRAGSRDSVDRSGPTCELGPHGPGQARRLGRDAAVGGPMAAPDSLHDAASAARPGLAGRT